MSRLEKTYQETIRPQLMKDLSITNVWAVPKMEKVIVNVGVGEASSNIKLLDAAMDEMGAITGQRPVMRRAKISSFRQTSPQNNQNSRSSWLGKRPVCAKPHPPRPFSSLLRLYK